MRVTLIAPEKRAPWEEADLTRLRRVAFRKGARWVVSADGPRLYLSLYYRRKEYLLHRFRGGIREFGSIEAIINLLREQFNADVFLVNAHGYSSGRVRSARPDRAEALTKDLAVKP